MRRGYRLSRGPGRGKWRSSGGGTVGLSINGLRLGVIRSERDGRDRE